MALTACLRRLLLRSLALSSPPCRLSIPRSRFGDMPKVSGERARTVLTARAAEPLVPDSVLKAATQGRRRSGRLAALPAAEQAAEVKAEAPATPEPADAAAAAAVKPEPAEPEPAEPAEPQPPKPQPAKKRRRKPAAKEAAAEAGTGEEAAPAKAAAGKPKRARRRAAADGIEGSDGEEAAPKPKRRRRKPKAEDAGAPPSEVEPAALQASVQHICAALGNPALAAIAPWEHTADGRVGGTRMLVGCHVSGAGGLERAVVNAAACGCRAFALDTRSKRRWESPPLREETIAAFKQACERFGFRPHQILPHGSYLINLASPDPEMAEKSYQGFLAELQRCEALGLCQYNFHPGSTTGGCTHEESMDRIAGFINRALAETQGVTVVLENMAGQKNIVGGKLWHLRYVIDRVTDKSRIGFCIDTCHLFSAGGDLRTAEACEATFREIDETVGLQYLKGLHMNDSQTDFASGRDRHANIGRGSIPMAAFRWLMANPALQGLPLIMETPVHACEPPVDHKLSLAAGKVIWKQPDAPFTVGTDRRDIMLLNSLAQDWE